MGEPTGRGARSIPVTSVGILGIGTAVPPYTLDQSEASRFASLLSSHNEEQTRLVAVLYRRSSVRQRHLAFLDSQPRGGEAVPDLQSLFHETLPEATCRLGPTTAERMAYYAARATPLAEQAARCALASAGVSPDAITHLVTVSCTGFVAPGVDVALITRLGLDSQVQRVHVGFMGCQGALNALRVARSLVRSADARVLVCAVELCALHFQYSAEPDAIVANSLFSDGAAAAVLGAAGDGSSWRLTAHGAGLVPDSLDAMTWTVGNHGFTMTLSPRVPSLVEEQLRQWMEPWLAHHGLGIPDVGSWAIHPGGARIVSSAEKALGLDATAGAVAREILAEHGNMSSPTVLFVLKRLMETGARRPCVALAFGPGLSIETALFT
jgi:predicted naringenin-chalcone synthase